MLPIYPVVRSYSAPSFSLLRTTVFSMLALSAATLAAQAAPTNKSGSAKPSSTSPGIKKPAPAAKPKPKLIREVMGTEQLVGYEGILGQIYTVGKDSPVNFTLKKANYSINRINVAPYAYLPKGDEKFLVLHFTVHNPLKQAFTYNSSYLNFLAVDANGLTRKPVAVTAREVTGEPLNSSLQPGQKVDVYTAIPVAAFGEVPKLIVQSGYEPKAPIVRFDLRGKVAKLAAPFGDATGVSAPRNVPAKLGAFYPVADTFDLRIDKVDYSTDKTGDYAPDAGKHYAVAHVTIVNRGPKPISCNASYFNVSLKDNEGEKVNYNGRLLKAVRDESSNSEVAPGESIKARFFWQIPEDIKAQALLVGGYGNETRIFTVEVTPVSAE